MRKRADETVRGVESLYRQWDLEWFDGFLLPISVKSAHQKRLRRRRMERRWVRRRRRIRVDAVFGRRVHRKARPGHKGDFQVAPVFQLKIIPSKSILTSISNQSQHQSLKFFFIDNIQLKELQTYFDVYECFGNIYRSVL